MLWRAIGRRDGWASRLLVAWALLLALLAVTRPAAADADLVDLAHTVEIKEARVHVGDAPGLEAPDLDDSGWERRSLVAVPEGEDLWSWWRIEITLAPRLVDAVGEDGVALALLGFFPFEVYADGERVFARRGLGDPLADGTWAEPVVVRVPSRALRDGRVVLAVRLYRSPALLSRPAWQAATSLRLGYAPLLEAKIDFQTRQRRWVHTVSSGVLATLLWIVGVAHLVLYVRRRELAGYLWYALFVLAISVWAAARVAVVNGWTSQLAGEGLLLSLAQVSCTLWGELVLRFLCGREPGPLWGLMRVALLAHAAIGLLGGVRVIPWLPVGAMKITWVGTFTVLFALVLREAWRGKPEARTTVLGVLVAGILLVVGTLTDLPARTGINITQFAVLPIVASMGLALLRFFGRALDETRAAAIRFVPFEFLSLLGRTEIRGVDRGLASERELSVMFADIRSFTTRLEGLTPEESFAFVNRYLQAVEPAIRERGGYVHQYLGDGIVAMFPGPADDALHAAIDMQRLIREFAMKNGAIEVGMGLHRGRVTLGIIGGREQLDAGVIGDTMNLAARVEGMSKLYGTRLVVTSAIVDALKAPERFALREIDRVVAKGRAEPTTIYESLDALDPDRRAARVANATRYAEALTTYRAGSLEAAREGLLAMLASDATDGVARVLLERTEAVLVHGVPSGWDGTHRLDSK